MADIGPGEDLYILWMRAGLHWIPKGGWQRRYKEVHLRMDLLIRCCWKGRSNRASAADMGALCNWHRSGIGFHRMLNEMGIWDGLCSGSSSRLAADYPVPATFQPLFRNFDSYQPSFGLWRRLNNDPLQHPMQWTNGRQKVKWVGQKLERSISRCR